MVSLFQSEEEKKRDARFKRIMESEPSEQYRKPGPLGDHKFPEENFFYFVVQQDKKPIKLQTYRYLPPGGEKEIHALLILFHGLNSHIGRCAHIAKFHADQGIAIFGFDHRGFGKSEGKRGYLEKDSERFITQIEKMHPNLPLFIGGQSMGGQTCFLLGLKHPQRFKGIIMYAPAIKDNEYNAKYGKFLAKIVSVFTPSAQISQKGKQLANKNPQIQTESEEDPFTITGMIVPGTVKTLINNSDFCFKNYEKFNVPFLAIQGEIDKLVDPDGPKLLIQRSPVHDKELLYYDNLWHNIWAEDEIDDINPKTLQWILKRLK